MKEDYSWLDIVGLAAACVISPYSWIAVAASYFATSFIATSLGLTLAIVVVPLGVILWGVFLGLLLVWASAINMGV